jgi:hypothetical protein
MGMRVSGSTSAWASQSTSSVSNWQTRQQGLKNLFSTLQAGDLSGAQKAFSAIAKVTKVDSNSLLGQLGEALKKGNLTDATQLAQQMQASTNTASPAQAIAQAKNAQNASMLNVLRGQAAHVDLLA